MIQGLYRSVVRGTWSVAMCAVVLPCAAQCPALNDYFAARQARNIDAAQPEERNAFAQEWLRVLSAARENCGSGLASARWHALSLANLLEQWETSLVLAAEGRNAAVGPGERAIWQEQVASIAFQARNPADVSTLTRAVNELDGFLALAEWMETGIRGQDGKPAWLLPSLNALRLKAICQREQGDFIGAAVTEQRAIITFTAARVEPESVQAGFLPEEAYFRASLDWLRADRPAEAAASLSTIRFLGRTARPAGQHAFNAMAELAHSPAKSVAFIEQIIAQIGIDEWTVLQAGVLASVVHSSDAVTPELLARARSVVNRVIDAGEGLFTHAEARLRALQASTGRPPEPDQGAGLYVQMLRQRARLEIDARDWAAATASVQAVRARGAFRDWCDEMDARIARFRPRP